MAAKELGRLFVGAEMEREHAALAGRKIGAGCCVGKCYGSLPVPRGSY